MYMEKENLHFYAHENTFRGLVYTPDVFLVNLEVAGNSYKAVVKEIQFHPVTDRLQHIDFMQVHEEKPVTINIPIRITGESSGVKAGGKLRIKRRTLKVKGLIKNLPDHLTIDITGLGIGQSIKIGDLKYDSLDVIDNKRAMIVSVEASRVSLKEEETAAPEAEDSAAEADAPDNK